MRTCFSAVQVNGLAEPFILVNFIIRMQQSIFWGKLSGEKMMCFYNPKVKFVDFHKKSVFKHSISDPLAPELASTAGTWGYHEKC